ncbi:hypothetical protein N9937_00910 [bacterium]|nr:hypothetical protein [bacterium]
MRFNDLGTNLTLLVEEAAEVQQIVCKIKRFGLGSYHPDKASGRTNRKELNKEVGDFLCIVDILIEQGILTTEMLEKSKASKLLKLEDWYDYHKRSA